MATTLERTIGELVAERPARARVFEGFKIDYCCGGKKPLADACQAKGIDPQLVLNMLRIVDENAIDRSGWDWDIDIGRVTHYAMCVGFSHYLSSFRGVSYGAEETRRLERG